MPVLDRGAADGWGIRLTYSVPGCSACRAWSLDRFLAGRFGGEEVLFFKAAFLNHPAAVFEVPQFLVAVVGAERELGAGFLGLPYEGGAGDVIAGVYLDGDLVFDCGVDDLCGAFLGPEGVVFGGYDLGQEGGICEDVDRLIADYGDDFVNVHIHKGLLVVDVDLILHPKSGASAVVVCKGQGVGQYVVEFRNCFFGE